VGTHPAVITELWFSIDTVGGSRRLHEPIQTDIEKYVSIFPCRQCVQCRKSSLMVACAWPPPSSIPDTKTRRRLCWF